MVSGIFAVLSLITTIYLLDHMEISTHARFYSPGHYQSDLNTGNIYKALKLIPEDAAVSASSALCPHLANRDKIYAFPNVKDAEYLVLLNESVRSTYPLSNEDYVTHVNAYKTSEAFLILYDKDSLLILKKK